MKQKTLLFILIFITGTLLTAAQEKKVEVKDSKVTIDGNQVLKHEKISNFEHSLYLQDDEIINIQFKDNNTGGYFDDDYFVINFIKEKVRVKSNNFKQVFPSFSSNKTMKQLVNWLLKEKILNPDGTLNPDKIETFFLKYNIE